jgi:hypothetical protein
MTLSLIRAEAIKATRQRGAFLSAFLLVPAFTTFLTCVLGGGILPAGQSEAVVPLFHSMARSLAVGGNPIAQLFFALGAASIFTVDYRYSGWRHLVPRSARSSLLGAKILAFALFAGASLLLVAAGDALAHGLVAAVRGIRPMVTDGDGASVADLCRAFAISWVELLSLGAIVAAVATVTRSTMAAVLLPFLLCLFASASEAYWGNPAAGIPLPTFAADALRTSLSDGLSPVAIRSAATLAVWCVAGFALAILLFQRQDLVAE